jgi:hypothetical protein
MQAKRVRNFSAGKYVRRKFFNRSSVWFDPWNTLWWYVRNIFLLNTEQEILENDN